MSANSAELREKAAAFKVGFLRAIADRGLLPDAVFDLTKQAFDPLEQVMSGAGGAMRNIGGAGLEGLKTLLGGLATTGVVAPMAIGGATGVGSAALEAPGEEDFAAIAKLRRIKAYEDKLKELLARRPG